MLTKTNTIVASFDDTKLSCNVYQVPGVDPKDVTGAMCPHVGHKNETVVNLMKELREIPETSIIDCGERIISVDKFPGRIISRDCILSFGVFVRDAETGDLTSLPISVVNWAGCGKSPSYPVINEDFPLFVPGGQIPKLLPGELPKDVAWDNVVVKLTVGDFVGDHRKMWQMLLTKCINPTDAAVRKVFDLEARPGGSSFMNHRMRGDIASVFFLEGDEATVPIEVVA